MKPGLFFDFCTLLVIATITTIFTFIGTKKNFYLREISGLNAIEEAIGRATEMGKKVHFVPGIGGIVGRSSASTLSSLQLLTYTAKKVANYGSKILVSVNSALMLQISQETIRIAYKAVNKEKSYSNNSVQFISNNQFAYATAIRSLLDSGEIAANIMIGSFYAEALMIAEAGNYAGTIQIAGTDNLTQIPFFIASCDYVLIGEEIFAAGAIVSNDRLKKGCIVGQDFSKIVIIAFLLVGGLLQLLK
ncbi:hypothetical protein IMX26_10020 [Clostridium sp. 'deep sea']|uniref:DUF6754 domain-containing protein n=1 Tax=Clostridium sp. 'deep sea' TaxID=2779445 RepID=UPI0018966AEE|nr:DUF6754 domain-containing protein [Clostridium sp. 'deep sea']QOR33838.1 hypothetical protein IMX26_10020 [Clostridium sp. 'deep sea']